jgi:hypothetical protein
MKKILSLTCVLFFTGIVFSHAVAQEKEKILILKLEGNKLTDADKKKFLAVLVEKIKKYTYAEILPTPETETVDLMVEMECLDIDADCMKKIGKSKNTDKIIYAEANLKGNVYSIKVLFTDVAKGTVTPVDGQSPSKEKVEEFLAASVEKFLGPEPKKEPVISVVTIRTKPDGAEVYIDKNFAGLTPYETKLAPGTYNMRLSKVGFKEVIETIKVEEGIPLTKELALAPIVEPKPVVAEPKPAVAPPGLPKKPPEPEKKPVEKPEEVVSGEMKFYETWWFWTAVGAVVVGAGTSILLLANTGTSSPPGNVILTIDSKNADWDPSFFK